MEVILKQDVPKLGRRGDVVKVADGFGRNFLLPTRKAIAATPANLRNIEHMRAAAQREEARDQDAARALGGQLAQLRLRFERRAGENKTLFGSVTSMDLASALEERGFAIDRRKIELGEPIKTTGQFTVPVQLYRGVTAELQVEVVPLAAEGAEAPAESAPETGA